MENAKKFFEETLQTEEAKQLLTTIQKPDTEQEVIDAYLGIASTLGVELTTQDILAYFSSSFSEESSSNEIDDEELSQLVGGISFGSCRNTFLLDENCWWNDSCNIFLKSYSHRLCSGLSNSSESAINRFNRGCGAPMNSLNDHTSTYRLL